MMNEYTGLTYRLNRDTLITKLNLRGRISMTISANSKQKNSKRQLTFSHRLTQAVLSLAVFAASLLLIACPSPDGGAAAAPPTYTTTVTGTVTTLPPGESSSIGLPSARVSALTTLPNSANQPITSRSDGGFTLQVKHSGTFKLKVEHSCYEFFTSAAVTVSAADSHDAGAISLTPVPEPTGTDRYAITPQSSDYNEYKLTVNCVRAIRNNEFSAAGTIITTANAVEGIPVLTTITEIALPHTLKSIGERGLGGHSRMSKTVTIPRNVETLGTEAFRYLKRYEGDGPTVVFATGSRLKTIGVGAFAGSTLIDFTLPENLETIENQAFFNVQFFLNTTALPSGALIIPAKVSKIGTQAFARVRSGITALDIRSKLLAKPPGATSSFPLRNDLLGSGSLRSPAITSITLPQKVYESYDKADLQNIFGSSFGNYRKPDGTAYNFATKP